MGLGQHHGCARLDPGPVGLLGTWVMGSKRPRKASPTTHPTCETHQSGFGDFLGHQCPIRTKPRSSLTKGLSPGASPRGLVSGGLASHSPRPGSWAGKWGWGWGEGTLVIISVMRTCVPQAPCSALE